jgi:hypothetical protein
MDSVAAGEWRQLLRLLLAQRLELNAIAFIAGCEHARAAEGGRRAGLTPVKIDYVL